ncbi:uncharacterized protein BX664DRAFT_272032 [Halteromyces radiatus]|uniref:uncharacterized protein n=1 Tax=Halteromyces radiatus TaxID=101107 RepID=UPI002220316D|nr:uncharacterized protein BX664DRAFT_272032 [Halteromyces radiatus]KAI8099028.1 hypothetical protein BX664DRAFT_272032 [Halteromyces radiatus]
METKTIERKPGTAPIKNEFRKERWFEEEGTEAEDGSRGVFGDDDAAEGEKFSKKDKKCRNERGANKGNRGKKRIEEGIKICTSIARSEPCTFGESCRFSHDLEAYLKEKPADLGTRCVQFELFGKCQRGYKCRYLNAHIDENNKLIFNEELIKKNPIYTKNGISAESQKLLTKRLYNFPKSDEYLKEVQAENKLVEDMKAENGKRKREGLPSQSLEEYKEATKKEKLENGDAKPVEYSDTEQDQILLDDLNTAQQVKKEDIDSDLPPVDMNVKAEDIKPIGPIDTGYKKLIDFSNKTYLAPLTTVGNLPFRRICKGFGVDITCGEMAMAANLLQGQQSEWALTKRHVSEDIFGVQICGSKVEQVVKACEAINNEVDVDFVDLNMGCPIDLVFNNGGGSALIDSRGKLSKMLKGMQQVMDIPVTVKFRMGIKENHPTADKLIPRFEALNIPLGTIHGRSRTQRYSRLADWNYIADLKKQTNTMKLYGNGDVLSFEDYNRHKEEAGIDGVMIGRGALIKPWLFEEIKTQRHWDISSRERFDMLKKFCDFGLEHWGSDSQGVNTTRRFLCEWQSFLYRYIPIGLLEVYPQKINQRAPPYFGRDELETLMASPKAADWVKLTERILGPAPEDFNFMPKHKANSFEG